MARTPNPKLHAVWRDRLRRQEVSGLTIAQFCVQECITRSKFYAWKRRFELMSPIDERPALPAPSAFLPVTVREVKLAPGEPLPIEAELPNGIRLRIPTSNARLACRLVRAVVAARTGLGGSR